MDEELKDKKLTEDMHFLKDKIHKATLTSNEKKNTIKKHENMISNIERINQEIINLEG